MQKKRLLFFSSLFCAIALAITLLSLLPQMHAHAQDCMDCIGGVDPDPKPSDPLRPDEPPGGDMGDTPGKPEDPHEPHDPHDPHDPPDPPCVPYFEAPAIIANLTLHPPYPITLGQDPDDRGVDVNGITARGGDRHCPNGAPAKIVSFSVVKVQLAQSSLAWISGELARKYPGAHVKGSYPFTPPYQVSGLGASQAQLSFQLAPLDPGYYEVTVQATQEDSQTATAILRVAVYLMESTIIK
jgi:hypothetical protein